jgi:hypothetical protein
LWVHIIIDGESMIWEAHNIRDIKILIFVRTCNL